MLGPLLYLLYTADIPLHADTILATFTDDTAVLLRHTDYSVAVDWLQLAVNGIVQWASRWNIQLNAAKTIRVDFALCPHLTDPLLVNGVPVKPSSSARYLGVHLDKELNWSVHVKKKSVEFKIRRRAVAWMLRADNKISLSNKRLLYKSVLRPIWTYGMPLWGAAVDTHVTKIQRQQNIVLRSITDAPKYVSNLQLHDDLNLETVQELITRTADRYIIRLHYHDNNEALMLLEKAPCG